MLPEDGRPGYHADEPQVVAAYRAAFDHETGPRFIAALGEMVTPRVVYGYEELREKVVCADGALAACAASVRDRYPALFDGVYVNVQRYRFEPEPGPDPDPEGVAVA